MAYIKIADLKRYALQLELKEPKGSAKTYRRYALDAFYARFPVDREEVQEDLERLRETRDNQTIFNQRRVQLIDRQAMEGSLTIEEETELKQLEKRISEYIAVVNPTPLESLRVMERKAKRLGFKP